jgi:hypothetical protein
MPFNSAPPVVVVPKKKRWGCVGCGCALAIVIVLLVIGLCVFGGRKAYQMAQGYTSAEPVTVAAVDAGPDVYNTAESKLNTFEQSFEREQLSTLHLNSAEINTLIARDPNWAQARGHVAVQLQGETATVQSSALLGDYEKNFMADRYANTNATFGLSFDPATQQLLLDVQSLTMNGQALPSTSSAGINQMVNPLLNQQLQGNQLARDFLARVKKMGIENGELVIETK